MDYKELLQSWEISKEEWRNYEWTCGVVAAHIFRIIKDELKAEDKLFKMIDPEEKDDNKIQNTFYSHIGALKLTENGWAKFGLYLIVQRNENTWPKNGYRFVSFVKVEDETIRFRIAQDSQEVIIKKDFNDNDFTQEDKVKIITEFDSLLNSFIKNSFINWHRN